MEDLEGLNLKRTEALQAEERSRFVAERPRWMELNRRPSASMPRGVPMAWMDDLYEHPPVWIVEGSGAYFTDVDENTYLDMYVADMSAFCGHSPGPVVEAVAERMALGKWHSATNSSCRPRTR
jgi:glutamate-1-semialdehyde aminotransferase